MNDPYDIQSIPGKGKGLVASRPVSRGELILAEAPLIEQDQSYDNSTILRALSALSEAQQREYFSLANVWKGVHPPPLGVFKTNALPCGDNDIAGGASAGSAAVFAVGSRFNSSCEPNVNNYWNGDMSKITFWAVRDIAEGEELTISYGEIFATRKERRARMKKLFKFECACVACVREGEELKESDERRAAIMELYGEIGQCAYAPGTGVGKVKQALKLLREEKLDVRAGSFCYDAFQFCASVADAKNAKAWARKALEEYSAVRGPDSEDAKKMRRYAKNPHAHLAFGMFQRQKLSGPD